MTGNFWRQAWASWRRDARLYLNYRLAVALDLLGLVLLVPVYFFLARLVNEGNPQSLARYGGDYFGFVIIGSGLAALFNRLLGAPGQLIRQAQLTGNLEVLLATPLTFGRLCLFSTLFPAFQGVLRFALKVALAAAAFGLSWPQADWLAALAFLLLAGAANVGLGLIAGSLVLLVKKGEPLTAVISYFTILASGVYFPVSLLPGWLEKAGALLPATHAVEGFRLALAGGASAGQLSPSFIWLVLLAAVFLPAGFLATRLAFRRALQSGALSEY